MIRLNDGYDVIDIRTCNFKDTFHFSTLFELYLLLEKVATYRMLKLQIPPLKTR